MNSLTSKLDNPSAHATTPNRILHAFLAAWWQGNVVKAAEQFRDRTFPAASINANHIGS